MDPRHKRLLEANDKKFFLHSTHEISSWASTISRKRMLSPFGNDDDCDVSDDELNDICKYTKSPADFNEGVSDDEDFH